LKELKDKYYTLKIDNKETIKKLYDKLNNYSSDIDNKCLSEDKNNDEIYNFNQNNEQ